MYQDVSIAFVPITAFIDNMHDEQHYRHFNQYAYYGGERSAGMEPAAATASSKKLLAPISAEGQAMLCFYPAFLLSQWRVKNT